MQQNAFSLERAGHRGRVIITGSAGVASVFGEVLVRGWCGARWCSLAVAGGARWSAGAPAAPLRVGQVSLRRVACYGRRCPVSIVAPAAVCVTVVAPPIVLGQGVVGDGSVGRRAAAGALECARRGVLAAGFVALAF